MKSFGRVSGWLAMPAGLILAALSLLQLSWGLGMTASIPLGAGLALLIGGFRTLRKMKGGLRLLAGAWGVTLGMFLGDYLAEALKRCANAHWGEGSYAVDVGAWAGWALIGAPFIVAAGLALTVLHKE